MAAFLAILQLFVVAPMNQRFDAQDQRLDHLTDEVAELRRLTVSIGERLPRSEGEIDS